MLFPEPLGPIDPEELAAHDLEVTFVSAWFRSYVVPVERMHERLLQTRPPLVWDHERLRDVRPPESRAAPLMRAPQDAGSHVGRARTRAARRTAITDEGNQVVTVVADQLHRMGVLPDHDESDVLEDLHERVEREEVSRPHRETR